MTDDLNYIQAHVPQGEILAQLAEEAAELAQAALKLRRALDGTNPTPVSAVDAWARLIEEHADVSLCLSLILDSTQTYAASLICESKAMRWHKRLEAYHDQHHGPAKG